MNEALTSIWEGMPQLVVTALLIESIIDSVKPIYDKTKGWQIDRVLTLLLGMLVCVLVKVDIFELVGIPMVVPYVGAILTGIVASRGANFAHDLIKGLQTLREGWAQAK